MTTFHGMFILYFKLVRLSCTVWELVAEKTKQLSPLLSPMKDGKTTENNIKGKKWSFLYLLFFSPILPLLLFHLFYKLIDKVRSQIRKKKGIFRNILRAYCKISLDNHIFNESSYKFSPHVKSNMSKTSEVSPGSEKAIHGSQRQQENTSWRKQDVHRGSRFQLLLKLL